MGALSKTSGKFDETVENQEKGEVMMPFEEVKQDVVPEKNSSFDLEF